MSANYMLPEMPAPNGLWKPGCQCKACVATNSAEAWPETNGNFERFARAKADGTAPKDSVYAAHARACFPPIKPFDRSKLYGQPMRFANGYRQRALTAPAPEFPETELSPWASEYVKQTWQPMTTARYVEEFERLNHLVSTCAKPKRARAA